ncbi:MAG TPA: OsmC family protein [Acidobacteriota bacterium]|nr:OsmC family protein [Acidobacteriota bacterium]
MAEDEVSVRIQWEEGQLFSGATSTGVKFSLEGSRRRAPSPMESLLASLCGCMAIDVIDILRKMRGEVRRLEVDATGRRNPQPPRYFNQIHLRFAVETDLPQERVDRAIQLSFETYCSVYHSLRSDIQVSHELEVRS